jgi:hypothetical protein
LPGETFNAPFRFCLGKRVECGFGRKSDRLAQIHARKIGLALRFVHRSPCCVRQNPGAVGIDGAVEIRKGAIVVTLLQPGEATTGQRIRACSSMARSKSLIALSTFPLVNSAWPRSQ